MTLYKKFANGLYKLNSALSKVELFVTTIGMTLLVMLMLYQVLTRYFLAVSAPWVEELSRMVFIVSTFWGLAYCTWKWDHIEINLIDNVIRKKSKDPARTAFYLKKAVEVILLVFLTFYLLNYNDYLARIIKTSQYSAAMHIHMGIPIGGVEAGLGLSLFHVLSLLLLPADNEREVKR